jgi:hypothetical protein
MPQPGVEELLAQLATKAKELADLMGVNPGMHGMLKGTLEMALAEAQGCGIAKPGAVSLSGSLQSTADLAARMQPTFDSAGNKLAPMFTRGQISGIFNHAQSMRDAANGIGRALADMESDLGQVSRSAPEAGRVARQGYQALMGRAAEDIQLANRVEEGIVEIANSGNANRLSSVVITETGRDAPFLASNQLQQRGLSLLPNALGQGRVLLQRISTLPMNADEAEDMLKDLVQKGAVGMTAAYNAVRAGGTAARSLARQAFETTGRFLAAFGARLVILPPLIPTKLLEGLGKPGFDPDQGG